MISRRGFGKGLGVLAMSSVAGFEAAMAQRALVKAAPPGTIWLNANEHPDGPSPAALMAMSAVLGTSGRYHYQEFPDFYSSVAKSEQLEPSQIVVGSGSSEILHMAIDAFTSPTRPLIISEPTYELPGELARAAGHPVIGVPLRKDYSADVKRLAEEAAKAKGGLVYICNPNNPTSSVTAKKDIAGLVASLPPDVVLLVDEAYLHFCESPDVESAMRFVKDGKNVVVARTFSKIYGMAGLRVGFGCAKADLTAQMARYRNNVVSYVSARAVLAALADESLVPTRRKQMADTRRALCEWLRSKKMNYIEPHANFIMIETGKDAGELIPKMVDKGIAIGRRFPALSKMVRVTIGTDQEMAKFRKAFEEVMQTT